MPKNEVSDLITDQEMAFARLVLSGTMTDRDAAQAVGLNSDTAAYTKSKPRVHAYMLERRAAMQQQFLDQESEKLRRKELRREQVLDRLWEIAKMAPEMTRGSITGQVKAISMIVAIEGLIPDRRAGSAENDKAAWLTRKGKAIDPQPNPVSVQEEVEPGLPEPESTPAPAVVAAPLPIPSESAFASLLRASEAALSARYVPAFMSAPDTRSPFSIKNNPFDRRR
jgi:hypothetical protein